MRYLCVFCCCLKSSWSVTIEIVNETTFITWIQQRQTIQWDNTMLRIEMDEFKWICRMATVKLKENIPLYAYDWNFIVYTSYFDLICMFFFLFSSWLNWYTYFTIIASFILRFILLFCMNDCVCVCICQFSWHFFPVNHNSFCRLKAISRIYGLLNWGGIINALLIFFCSYYH